MAPLGYLSLVLHAHLPFVRHPEYDHFMEEDWLFEAITETYLPILDVMERLVVDGADFRLTMSLSPPLISMLNDELLRERYRDHLIRLIELAEREVERTAATPEFNALAHMYRNRFGQCFDAYEHRYRRDLVGAFRRFMDLGKLEIITCGATHGFLPLMQSQPEAVNAQVAIAVEQYKQAFGRAPKGMWNGECGYFPGLEDILARHGIEYFFVESHGVLFASKRPRYGVFAPIRTPAGPHAFGRDVESSKSVWSAEQGYPGDFRYREFYRDIGFDLDLEYLRPFIHESGIRTATGVKYYRITGKGSLRDKLPYVEEDAREAAATHAGHFMFCRQQQVLHLSGLMDRPPLITAPYDAELFGHWWYEGPQFLDFLMRKIHYDQDDIEMITPSEYLRKFPNSQPAQPCMSSWGHGGFNRVWLEGSNDWIYRHLHEAADRMIRLANTITNPTDLQHRALNQAARELLLAQSSDWAFIMKTNTVVDYAVKRTTDHITQFMDLSSQIENDAIDEELLRDLEWRDNIFPKLDYRVYQSPARG
jgi:1,4-alpha-glucan branching enzyme